MDGPFSGSRSSGKRACFTGLFVGDEKRITEERGHEKFFRVRESVYGDTFLYEKMLKEP